MKIHATATRHNKVTRCFMDDNTCNGISQRRVREVGYSSIHQENLNATSSKPQDVMSEGIARFEEFLRFSGLADPPGLIVRSTTAAGAGINAGVKPIVGEHFRRFLDTFIIG